MSQLAEAHPEAFRSLLKDPVDFFVVYGGFFYLDGPTVKGGGGRVFYERRSGSSSSPPLGEKESPTLHP